MTWGHRYLMCPPDHFEVTYAITPWMGGTVDRDRAQRQWHEMVATLRMAGAVVEVIEPVTGLPDMVFTANAGVVDGTTFVPGAMRHPERRGETEHFRRWAAGQGMAIAPLSDAALLEGLGDCMPLGDALVVGHGGRSNLHAHRDLTALTGRRVIGVALADPRWYHVDLTLCPLDDRRAIVHPAAYDAAGARQVMASIPEPLVLTEAEAATFAANAVVVGSTVIMPACPPRIGARLEAWGYDVVVVDVSEFTKAGGAVRCLTLPLDTALQTALQTARDCALEVA
ncbi:MAG TPA: arginine deiminase-related protein [Euzebya sp.]|nr:arginine deiminase-related protein [Euzebya sp.]